MTTERQQHHLPPELHYASQARLWVHLDWGIATIGLTSLALEIFGDIVYVSTIKTGQPIERGQAIGSIEAAKMVDDLVAPVSGEVLAFNEEVQRHPGVINTDPYGSGWLVKVSPSAWEQESAALLHGPALDLWIEEHPGELVQ